MITKIHISKLIVKASIGITPAERAVLQPLMLDICLTIDASQAIATDNVEHTISYSILQKEVQEYIKKSSYNLLETLAAEISKICFANAIVQTAEITILKPHILLGSESAGITLTTNRHEHHLP